MSQIPPKARRVGRLHTVGAIAHELGKVYREVAKGALDAGDGVRRAMILRALRECLEIADVEARMTAIEDRLGLRSGRVVPFLRRDQRGVAA